MNRNDLKNPLIQSGALLLFAFLLISIVAGSGSGGILGSIGALFSGLVSAVIFIIALSFAIIISIAVIIGIYVAAVSIYSIDKGRDLIDHLKGSLSTMSSKVGDLKKIKNAVPRTFSKSASTASESPAPKTTAVPASQSPAAVPSPQTDGYKEKLDGFDARLRQVSQATAGVSERLDALLQKVDELSEATAMETRLTAVEDAQQAVSTQITDMNTGLETNTTALQKLIRQLEEEMEVLKQDVASLHEKTSVPEVISGILSYLDTQEDRDLVTEKAKEAISRNMTYSQIDDFFKDSLPSAVYQELAEHPRLTKDFLRSIKKKF